MRTIVLALLAGTVVQASAAQPASQPARVTSQTLRQSRLELWQSSIMLPSAQAPSQDLRASVTTLQTMAPTTRPAPKPATQIAAATAPATAPAAEPAVAVEMPATQPAPAAQTQPAKDFTGAIDPQIMEQLKKAPAKGPSGALALADALFSDGQLETAFTLYEQAMAGTLAPQDKAWAVFQMGNCRIASDANAAVAFYCRVVSEHADCVWATVAAQQVKTIQWQQGVNPQAVLQALNSRQKTPTIGADANAP